MITGTMPKQVEYALMALADMRVANPGRLFSAREIGALHGIPFDVMAKTLQRLGRAGVLRSVQGKNGGYQLVKELSLVSLLDVMTAVLGDVGTVACLKKEGGCKRSAVCNIAGPMRVLDLKLRALYGELMLMDFLGASEAGSDAP